MNAHDYDWMNDARKRLENDVGNATGLPSAAYTSEAYLDLEKRTTFHNRWISIGFASDLSHAGDIRPIKVLGRNLCAVRDDEGVVRVFHNLCPHRGTQLVARPESRKLIVCPYHAWSFDLRGTLCKAPRYEQCDKEKFSLREIRSAIWNDVVFINFSGSAPPLSEVLAPLNRRWAAFDFRHLSLGGEMTYDFPANWKLIAENFLECYHVPSVHPSLSTYSKFGNRYPIIFNEEFIG